ncbi:MAG: phospholipase D family protein [Actinomycetota bacterium]|nr:hypothetical protein [Euzebyaceae bacterium]MDQ3432833.1 phospholipase D family protein [Actinomycetota bacterium]
MFGDTTAGALRRAAELGVDVRLLNLPRGTYHPKLYLSRSGTRVRALVGSANLTSRRLRNIEVAVLLTGEAEAEDLCQLCELAESWWAHPACEPWTPDVGAPLADTFPPDLWEELRAVLAPGSTVRTLAQGRPNRIVELTREAVWIETERSARLGRGAEPVPAWMLNIAWDHLAARGRLTNRHLVATDGLNVKRSSAVCAILATMPSVEVLSRSRPIELALRAAPPTAAAAEERSSYDT